MKKVAKVLTVLCFVSALAATNVLAQVHTITLDENGKGFYDGVAIAGGLVAADPSGGVAGSVLLYTIPGPALTIGDVLLSETTAGGPASDVVRFWEFNQVIFYSERDTAGSGDSDLADTSGLPAQFLSNNVLLFESGPEGQNGATYLAGPGNPGWDQNPNGTQYQFISDVPEPGSLLLASLGGGLLLVLRARRLTKA